MASPYSTVSFPDNTTLSSSALTPQQMLLILQPLTYQMLGINPPTFNDARVRLDWQQTGQPAFSINTDTVALNAVEEDQEYSRIRELSLTPFTDTQGTGTFNYQRTWRCSFNNYGPNCFDCARLIIDCLFLPWVETYLASNNLYLVPDIKRPVYLKEMKDGQWWPRTDVFVLLNESVTETFSQPTVSGVEVIVEYVAEEGNTFARVVPPVKA